MRDGLKEIGPILAAYALAGLMVLLSAPGRANAESPFAALPEVRARHLAQRQAFSDDDILRGFMATTLGAELSFPEAGTRRGAAAHQPLPPRAASTARLRRFEMPVRVFIDRRDGPDRSEQTRVIIADIARHIAGLDLAVTDNRAEANVTVTLLRQRSFRPALIAAVGRERARTIARRLDPQCLTGIAKDEGFRIRRAEILLITDTDDATFADCAYEELLQALGPMNDTSKVPWTMFNDAVQMGFFDIYDQFILNLVYHPTLRAGMTGEEAGKAARQALPEVRAFVARQNGLDVMVQPPTK